MLQHNLPIVLQKSSLRGCRIKICNNRIGANGFLNQRCALTPDLESILRAWTGKIVLQHNRHEAADRGSATSRQILRIEQTCHGRRGTAESDPNRTWIALAISRLAVI